jgi:hypothetical protein
MRCAIAAACGLALGLATFASGGEEPVPGVGWDPDVLAAIAAASTVELQTTAPGEAPHWFPVWVVVVDGQAYVRLGSRAAARVESDTKAPYLAVRAAGREFPRVKGEPVPELAERVAQAMRDKYWMDVLVRHVTHPLTLRLVPATSTDSQ